MMVKERSQRIHTSLYFIIRVIFLLLGFEKGEMKSTEGSTGEC